MLIKSLSREHGTVMLAYATQLTHDRMAAEDAVQEALVRAWLHSGSLHGGCLHSGGRSVRGWLLTVVRNIVTDQVRARNARARESRTEPPDLPSKGDIAEQVTSAMVVYEALQQLSPEHREVLEHIYLRGNTVRETAAALSIPAGTVKSRSFYALRALRDRHARHFAAAEMP
ncbi:sigma-70 family RNA polymerase sigma factor [Actinoplanes sp. NPDC049596]|uniref:sigma-70 family RNA polymerase sigma factor n=1 Tax=unclassified Actinoplanes TaxID=2626549 RepID=UPI003426E754